MRKARKDGQMGNFINLEKKFVKNVTHPHGFGGEMMRRVLNVLHHRKLLNG